MKGFVYILKNDLGKLYVGSTDNIERRIKQHNRGHTQTTRNMGNLRLVLCQEYKNLVEARQVENKIKKLKRKDYIEKMIETGYIKIKI